MNGFPPLSDIPFCHLVAETAKIPELLTLALRLVMRLTHAEGAFISDLKAAPPYIAAHCGLHEEHYSAAQRIAQLIGEDRFEDFNKEGLWRSIRVIPLNDDAAGERHILVLVHTTEALNLEIIAAPEMQDLLRIAALVLTTQRVAPKQSAENRMDAMVSELTAFKDLFDESPVPKLLIHPETKRLTASNAAAEKLFGLSAEQLQSLTAFDMTDPSEHAALRESWTSMLATRRSGKETWNFRTASGFNLRVEALSRPIQVQGEPAVLTELWDGTAQLTAENALRESEQKLQHMTNNLLQAQRMAHMGTWKWYPKVAQIRCSDDLAAMLGKPPVTILMSEEKFIARIHLDDREAMVEALSRLRRGFSVFDIAFRVAHEDGSERFLLFSGNSDEDGTESSSSGFCQDVTQRKLSEERLLRDEKMRSLGQLTGGITHDFNNLLTVISANIELALDETPAETPLARLLTNALRATDTGAKLNSHLLSFARRQPLRAASVAVAPFLAGLVELARRTLGANCSILLEVSATPLHVRADAAHLETAVINLCLNARDAMPQGGTIQIAHSIVAFGQLTRRRWRDADKAKGSDFPSPGSIEDLPPGSYGCISVSDTGIGMTDDIKARIFEPFFTTKSQTGGTGLGLSMVVGFAKQSGGGLAVESSAGQGTCFRMYLPLADAVSEKAPVKQERRPAQMKGRVLLVDDEDLLRESAGLMLRSLGLEVDAVPNAAEAMDLLTPPLRFDLLFSDVALGSQPDGVVLCEWARAAWPELGILLSSGFVEQELKSDKLVQLRAEFLAKPYRRQALRTAVEAALRRSLPLMVTDSRS